MRKLNTVAKWFLRLFLLFISFTVIMVFIFLFRPEYFIDDIELIIKNKFSNSIDGELNIGSMNGNFVTGFRVSEVDYSKDSTIIFSAKEIYIDPDLSKIAFGTIAFSEVIVTSMYFNFQSSQLDGIQYNGKPTISLLNTEIASLIIDDGLFVIMDQLYKLNGELVLNYSDVVELDINSLNIHSPAFQDVLVFQSGNLIYNNEKIELSNIIINSHWVAGKANIIVNIEDFQKLSANIHIDKFFLELMNGSPIKIHKLNVEIDSNNRILNAVLKCDADFLNRKYTDIFISGIINKNLIEFDKVSLIVDGQHITSTGLINILEKSWEVKANIDEFELTKNTIISGEITLKSDFNLDHFNGNLLLINSLIDSVEISSISGQFGYNDGILSSDNISVESEGQISNFNIYSFADIDNFNIYGNIELRDFSDKSFISKYELDSLNGDINISWIKNFDVNNIDLDINLENGLLYENKFNGFNGNISGAIVNGDFRGSSSGKLIGWEYYTYNWDIIKYNIDILKEQFSNYQFNAISATGDSIYISAEKEPEGDLFISECAGTLKQNKLNIQPFYANKRDDYYHFPIYKNDGADSILINLGESEIKLKGIYQNNNNYKIGGTIHNLELNNLYVIIGKTFRINGLINFATIGIDNNNQINPNTIYSATIDMKNGAIDDIQFESFKVSAFYSNRALTLYSFKLDTYLGNFNVKNGGQINFGLTNNWIEFHENDQINLHNITFENVDISKFNRYLPWDLESRGFMTGEIDLSGTANKPYISSHMDISEPGFDKINGENLSGDIVYKENKLDFRKLLFQTKNGRYSGFGFLLLDLNLIYLNEAKLLQTKQIEISHRPIDFVFTGLADNIEFLPPYFDILDSLSSTYSFKDSLNSYSLELLLTGTLANPIRNGTMIIQNGIIFLDPIEEPIDNINGNIKISNNQLIINELSGSLHKIEHSSLMNYLKNIIFSREIEIQNNVNVNGSIDLTILFNPDFALSLSGDNISLSSSYDLFHGTGDMNINITGSDTMYIAGQLIPAPYDFTITSLGSDKSIKIPKIYTNRIISYDFHVPINEPIKVTTDNINILFEGDLNISKIDEEDFNFSGKAEIIDGSFYDNQGNIFQNTNGTIIFSPVNNIPLIDIHAQTIIDTLIDVSLIGYSDNPTLFFNSEDYTQTEILQILTFNNAGDLNESKQAGNILANYLENQIEKNIARSTKLDEFQLTSKGSILDTFEGNDIDLNIILGKQVSNRIYLNTQFNLNELSNNSYEATYRLNKNNTLVGGLDENNLWHLKYRIKYYY